MFGHYLMKIKEKKNTHQVVQYQMHEHKYNIADQLLSPKLKTLKQRRQICGVSFHLVLCESAFQLKAASFDAC